MGGTVRVAVHARLTAACKIPETSNTAVRGIQARQVRIFINITDHALRFYTYAGAER
jgi:hypothetical protein